MGAMAHSLYDTDAAESSGMELDFEDTIAQILQNGERIGPDLACASRERGGTRPRGAFNQDGVRRLGAK